MVFNIFKKSKENEIQDNNYLTLRIRETVKETKDTITIYFEQPEPFLDYQPGQFLTVILNIEGKEVRRSYSLCTSPYVDPFPGITVKRLDGGLVSNYINDYFKPGKKVSLMKPMGNFISDYHSKNRRHYGMIAGGSGITPMMGILKSVLVNEPESKVSLLYSSRSEELIIFNRELESLRDKYAGRLEIIHNLSQPKGDWSGLRGRLDKAKIELLVREKFTDSAYENRFFLCGPQGIMDLAKETLLTLGVEKEFLISESFYQEAVGKVKTETENDSIVRPVTIILEGREHTIDVSPGKTILEAGLEEDLDMPYSCQSGLCTACRGRVLSGEVKMEEDAGLSENEIKEGYILCCSAKPAGPGIKINIE